ncbi:hypothetical protein DLAC_11139 [Tieghemostelium lacteum]|uniref:RRM domain-containing protein n=1 Tax=Tieghemostelium lacteum TaxID=361077 RepID=A0A151Z3B3_TIELA|nr:hypothetical protein DLAC_11139 [Tieghemostelium lacteum]|eukprot:KYQ88435.1 hypothetical protein DLAC_11139 [Tieghemostelium lacteum]
MIQKKTTTIPTKVAKTPTLKPKTKAITKVNKSTDKTKKAILTKKVKAVEQESNENTDKVKKINKSKDIDVFAQADEVISILSKEDKSAEKQIKGNIDEAKLNEEYYGMIGSVLKIKNLPHGFNELELVEFFRQFGRVEAVKVVRTKKTLVPYAAFVRFSNPEVAKIAQETMNGYIMFEKRLVITISDYQPHISTCYTSSNYKLAAGDIEEIKQSLIDSKEAKIEAINHLEKTDEVLTRNINTRLQQEKKLREQLEKAGITYQYNGYSEILKSAVQVKKSAAATLKKSKTNSAKTTKTTTPVKKTTTAAVETKTTKTTAVETKSTKTTPVKQPTTVAVDTKSTKSKTTTPVKQPTTAIVDTKSTKTTTPAKQPTTVAVDTKSTKTTTTTESKPATTAKSTTTTKETPTKVKKTPIETAKPTADTKSTKTTTTDTKPTKTTTDPKSTKSTTTEAKPAASVKSTTTTKETPTKVKKTPIGTTKPKVIAVTKKSK